MVAEGITVELNLGGAVVPGPWKWDDRLRRRASRTRFGASRRATAWIPEPRAPRSTSISRASGSSPASSGRRSRSPSSCTSRAASRSRRATVQTVQVTGGLLTGLIGPAVSAILDPLGITLPAAGSRSRQPARPQRELSFMTIGASNVHAFIGMNGPYWTDSATATRTSTRTRMNDDAIGLVIDDFDFGLAIMKRDEPARLRQVLRAQGERQRNQAGRHRRRHRRPRRTCSSRSTSRAQASTACRCSRWSTSPHVCRRRAADAVQPVRRCSDAIISTAETGRGAGPPTTPAETIDTVEQLVLLLDVGGAPPEVLTVKEVLDQLDSSFKSRGPTSTRSSPRTPTRTASSIRTATKSTPAARRST